MDTQNKERELTKYKIVIEFFDKYKQYATRVWGLQTVEGELTYEGFGNEIYRVLGPGLSTMEIQSLQTFLPKSLKIPEVCLVFWKQFRFFQLGTPLVNFYSTELDSFQEETIPIFRTLAPLSLIPIATDENGGVSYCIDMRTSSKSFGQIVLTRPSINDGEIEILESMFSSFEHLLKILIAIMSSTIDFYIEDSPNTEQAQLIESLKLIDPTGFGGVGWKLRWKQWFYRNGR